MNIIADLVIALLLLLGVVIGFKKGFIEIISRPIKLVGALFAAFYICGDVGTRYLAPFLAGPVSGKLTEIIERSFNSGGNSAESIPTLVKITAGIMGIDLDNIINESGTDGVAAAVSDALCTPLVEVISSIIAFVLIYFIVKLVLLILFKIIEKFVDFGITGVVNKILGAGISFAFSVIVCWCLCSVTDFILHQPSVNGNELINVLENGFLYPFFKRHGPIELLLSF